LIGAVFLEITRFARQTTIMSGPRKTAIVTGASQGIGAGIVKALVKQGAHEEYAI
jgi:NADP-dependent 3-hydroxy acid dehydrogenase YdfG